MTLEEIPEVQLYSTFDKDEEGRPALVDFSIYSNPKSLKHFWTKALEIIHEPTGKLFVYGIRPNAFEGCYLSFLRKLKDYGVDSEEFDVHGALRITKEWHSPSKIVSVRKGIVGINPTMGHSRDRVKKFEGYHPERLKPMFERYFLQHLPDFTVDVQ